MFHKDSLCIYFSGQTLISDIEKAEKAFEPIFSFVGIRRGNIFIKQFTEELKTNDAKDFDFKRWFESDENIKAARKATELLSTGFKYKLFEDQEIKDTVAQDVNCVIEHISSHTLDSSEKEFKELLSYIDKQLTQEYYDFNEENFKKKEQLRSSLINKAFNNLTELISNELKGIISFDTAFSGARTHALLNGELTLGRYSRTWYESVCSPKKDLSYMENRLNEGGVDCNKCLIKSFNIIKNKNKVIK